MFCWPHWEEGEDERGLPVWLLYLECGHWGLILDPSRTRVRWLSLGIPWRQSPLFSECTS